MFKKVYLKNNIPLVMEKIPGVRSVSLGIWLKVGSRYEKDNERGLSHFLEHMFFKGTTNRSQKDIACEVDALGADLNAFTSKETTTFYVKSLDEYLKNVSELLSDILLNSIFPSHEIEKEKGVVIEEIRMSEDTPDDYVHDLFNEFVWNSSGLGHRILGEPDTIATFNREMLLEYIKCHYTKDNMVVSCAGNIDYQKVQEILDSSIGEIKASGREENRKKPIFNPVKKAVERDSSEIHICMGVEGVSQTSPHRYALLILNTIMGMGVSSRLFQEIREEKGLAYTVYSFASSYFDTGLFGVYVGTSSEKYKEVISIVLKHFNTFKDTVTIEEIERAKKQLRGNIILALESTSGRMTNIARQEIYYGRYYSPDEIIQIIDGVDIKEVKELADMLFGENKTAITLLGPVKEI